MSLKELINTNSEVGDQTTVQNKSENNVSEPDAVLADQAITVANLQVAWKKYVEQIKNTNIRLFSILNNQEPAIKDDTTIVLELTSPVQELEIKKSGEELLLYLKEELRNHSLRLETFLQKGTKDTSKKIFTANDKLQAMIEKNPALAELKKNLNLDLD